MGRPRHRPGDAWDGRGIGRAPLGAALGEAACRGLTAVRMHVHAENTRLVRRLSAGATSVSLADGVVVVSRPLADLLGRTTAAPLVA